MNRVGLGLAVGAGYVLGRTKKMKLAFAVGSLVAGKKMNLTPKGIADLLSQQLRDNPQFKEIGDQLRQDLRGVGKAASGAMVERQMEALANRLHGRTAEVRDQIEGVVPGRGGERSDDEADDVDEDEEYDEPRGDDAEDADDAAESRDDADDEDDEEEPPRKTAAKKAPAKRAAKKAPAKKAPAKKAAARGTAAKKTASARKTGARTASGAASRTRRTKEGGDR
ncbi:DNA primase [Streptomyces asoensis]|uniref:DNA primase n=1 Tax=Streptomyces asoensis TaxID=249586 RepID=UPI0033F6FC0A